MLATGNHQMSSLIMILISAMEGSNKTVWILITLPINWQAGLENKSTQPQIASKPHPTKSPI